MNKRILIIDDDPDVILFLSTLLEDNGYRTLSAQNGREGLKLIESERPDLVLLDLMMPQKSGLSLLSEMKGRDELKEIPVIMVTGVAGETGIEFESFLDKKPGTSAGPALFRPDGYVEKPVDPDKLLALVKEVLK
ncbi:MAG: response regulator [Deltaproteobacteria bacterium]|nr:response regulator [Deltaproteobacteria bacterium]MBW2015504.1 response regulator [Deltaproteobacteria bacterium]MBW2128748.1 response regulator [Deltaproteobacteria bacterium]MBW2303924.1 response regulator [Deltaproteobacteria bacterium]